jgi:hypothetical protein
MSREESIQEQVRKYFEKKEIYSHSIIYTYEFGGIYGLLGITLYNNDDLQDLLKLLDYNSLCDKTGYVVIEEYNTLIISGSSLAKLLTNLSYEKY